MKHAKIIITLIGTEGELDVPERVYAVRHLRDQAEIAKAKIIEIAQENPEYKKYGWSIVAAHKALKDRARMQKINNNSLDFSERK